jgi:3-oxoacyl-ACP reductase-like protein
VAATTRTVNPCRSLLDYIITLADVPENGREIDAPDDKSELAHRIMLVKLLRLLGVYKLRRRTVKSLPAHESCPRAVIQS